MVKEFDHIVGHERFLLMDDYTLGMVDYGGKFPLFCLEDQYQEKKVKGETCFAEGLYELKIQEILTPLTKKYRAKYPWFEYFIEITGLTNFDQVYPHIGNDDEDTDACPLLGLSSELINPNGWVSQSTAAYRMFYQAIYPMLKAGKRVGWHTKLLTHHG
jgi:hypothetical protein